MARGIQSAALFLIASTTFAHAQEISATGYGYFVCSFNSAKGAYNFVFSSPVPSVYSYGSEGAAPPEPSNEDANAEDPTDDAFWDVTSDRAIAKARAQIARAKSFKPIFENEWKAKYLTALEQKYGSQARQACSAPADAAASWGPYESAEETYSMRRIQAVGEIGAAVEEAYEKNQRLRFSINVDEIDIQ